MDYSATGWLDHVNGWLAPDVYSTAWVAMIPDAENPGSPAWPQALSFLRSHQLEDGGWGARDIYYAHERTISTLAALRALHTWQSSLEDSTRIKRAIRALRRYARDLESERYEPVGFELLLPTLGGALSPFYGSELPYKEWAPVEELGREKLALIRHLRPEPASPRAWWFSLEMLPEEQLARLDDSILERNGSIVTSTAATAAYLLARRRAGSDSPRAARYLSKLVHMDGGGVPFSFPAEVFERVWVLDHLRRARFNPRDPAIKRMAAAVRDSWDRNQRGLSSSDWFKVNDGDDTLVGYTVLAWAGDPPPAEDILMFWNEDHFRSYLDERDASLSANIHGLTALRSQPGFPYRHLAEKLTGWLVERMNPETLFDDKWHISPYYSISHAIPAFAGWNMEAVSRCVNFLIDQQHTDGGWGWFGRSTLEESAQCTLGLYHAFRSSIPGCHDALARVAGYFQEQAGQEALEPMYVGKTLFRSEGIVNATVFGALAVLKRLGYSFCEPPEVVKRMDRLQSEPHA
jgi:hypothetical protein